MREDDHGSGVGHGCLVYVLYALVHYNPGTVVPEGTGDESLVPGLSVAAAVVAVDAVVVDAVGSDDLVAAEVEVESPKSCFHQVSSPRVVSVPVFQNILIELEKLS